MINWWNSNGVENANFFARHGSQGAPCQITMGYAQLIKQFVYVIWCISNMPHLLFKTCSSCRNRNGCLRWAQGLQGCTNTPMSNIALSSSWTTCSIVCMQLIGAVGHNHAQGSLYGVLWREVWLMKRGGWNSLKLWLCDGNGIMCVQQMHNGHLFSFCTNAFALPYGAEFTVFDAFLFRTNNPRIKHKTSWCYSACHMFSLGLIL